VLFTKTPWMLKLEHVATEVDINVRVSLAPLAVMFHLLWLFWWSFLKMEISHLPRPPSLKTISAGSGWTSLKSEGSAQNSPKPPNFIQEYSLQCRKGTTYQDLCLHTFVISLPPWSCPQGDLFLSWGFTWDGGCLCFCTWP
uniref:Uncharacterized protein n=1 Tax=Theropithecus gelada TaxID=9565 RepID=A0A8D2ENU8_THEGE